MSKTAMMWGAGLVAAGVLVAGCGNGADDSKPAQTTTSSAAAGAENSGEAHNDADVMFAQHMIPHHRQAVEMSDMLLGKTGIDPRVTELATQIKGAQGPEIEQMQGWLTQWGNPAMPPMGHGGEPPMDHGGEPPMDHGGEPPMEHGDMGAMQGMVSEADMNALRDAQGVEAAKLYLTHMVAHHEGAIGMAKDEIDGGQYPAAVAMAKDIVTTQQQEIDTMRQILGSL